MVKYIFSIFFFCGFLTSVTHAAVRVSAQVDSSETIYVGDRFEYHIVIDGDNKPGDVNLTPLAEYSPQNAGNRDLSQTSISIINGKTTQTVNKRYVMSYALVCNQAGPLRLPSVSVTLDGKQYQTNPVQINILKPDTTDQLDLEITLSEQQCYVGQPVVMTVNFYVSAEIGNFQFNIPAFTGHDFDIEEPDVADQPTKEYNLGNGIMVRVSQSRTVHNGKDSILLSFSKVLIPKHPGEIACQPATVSADVAVGRARSQDRFFDDFFGARKEYKRFQVTSQTMTLKVSPLPGEKKPPSFNGLVGQYTISASAAPTKVNVGDPITLTIKIGGSRYLKSVQWPALESLPEFANNFKIPSEKASPTIENGSKIFTQTIRAGHDKVTEIPAIPLVYFDAAKKSYETAKTEPIKLEVSATKILTQADLEGMDSAPVNKEIEVIKKGLSANYESPDVLINQTFSPIMASIGMPYVFIWASPLVLLLGSGLTKLLISKTPEQIAVKRRRSAATTAIAQLKRIKVSRNIEGFEQLGSALKLFIGNRFDRNAGSLTSNDCYEMIVEKTKDSQLAEQCKDTVATCEAARYAPVESTLDISKIKETIELIRAIEKKSAK